MFKNFLVLLLSLPLLVHCSETEYDLNQIESESLIGFLSGAIAITEPEGAFTGSGSSTSTCPILNRLTCNESALTISYNTSQGTGLTAEAVYPASSTLYAHAQTYGCQYESPIALRETWFEGKKIATFSGGATCSNIPKSNTTGKMVIKHTGRALTYIGSKHWGEIMTVNAANLKTVYSGNRFHSAFIVGQSTDEMGMFLAVPQEGNDNGITVTFSGSGTSQTRRVLINNAHVVSLNENGVVTADTIVYSPKGSVNNGVQSAFVVTGAFDLGNGQVQVTLENGAVTTEHLIGGYITQTEIEEPLIYVRGCQWPVKGKLKSTLRGSYNGLEFKKDTWDNDGKAEVVRFDQISDITDSTSVRSELCGKVSHKHFSAEEYGVKQLVQFF